MTIQANFPAIKPSLMLDFANTKQLDSRITYTRASTASYYDGVTTSMAEQNLVTYSQDLSNASWGKSAVTVSADSTTAPDGTTTADTVTASATTGYHSIGNSGVSAPVSATSYVFSIYAKANGYTKLILSDGNAGRFGVAFDLTAVSVLSNYGAGYVSAAIISVGNGWYRCNVAFTSSTTAFTVNAGGYPDTGATLNSFGAQYTGDATNGVFLWGAQLEQRSAVTAYTATTTQAITNYIPKLQSAASGVARFDNNPTTGESLGLLIEESRTNLNTYSSQFDNAAWSKTNATITSDTIVAPDGTLTGDKFVESATNSTHTLTQTVNITNGTSYTATFYAKASQRSFLIIQPFGNSVFAYFNLSTGAVGFTSGSPTSTSMTNVGNGWYRCLITATAASTGAVSLTAYTASTDGTASYAGDGFSGIYIWGAQVELGAFATSYIPTVASQVTRAADAASMTGTNFSSWYNQGEGTFYTDAQTYFALVNGTTTVYYAFLDSSNYIAEKIHTDQHIRVVYNGTTVANLSGGTEAANTFHRVAGAYKTNDFALSLNGATIVTDTSGNVPTGLTTFSIGFSTGYLNGTIKKIAYYPVRLSNTNLVALTS